MGKNNRQRRAAKARKRAREGRHRSGGSTGSGAGSFRGWAPTVSDRVIAAAYAERAGEHEQVSAAVDSLVAERPVPVALEIAVLLERHVSVCWERGWQPADLDRVARRELAPSGVAVVRAAIASEAASYEDLGARVAPGWMAQLDRIGAARTGEPGRPWPLQLGLAWPDVVLGAVRAMGLVLHLPALEHLVDPPSRWRDGGVVADDGSLPASVLEKVRALLAKAESTTFDAEAEAFTAKAQELMTRHRIDQAVIGAQAEGRGEVPLGRRVGVEDPYAEAKAALLAGIADANGCHAVWCRDLGFSTVFGFAADLGAVEELFTSLLVQATAALRREGSKQDHAGRSRTTRFRRSFLAAFANRVGQRLREAVDTTVDAASAATGTALVPLLAGRDEAVRAAVDAAFPDMDVFAPSATDREGWYAGTLFGDQADLALGPELTRRSA